MASPPLCPPLRPPPGAREAPPSIPAADWSSLENSRNQYSKQFAERLLSGYLPGGGGRGGQGGGGRFGGSRGGRGECGQGQGRGGRGRGRAGRGPGQGQGGFARGRGVTQSSPAGATVGGFGGVGNGGPSSSYYTPDDYERMGFLQGQGYSTTATTSATAREGYSQGCGGPGRPPANGGGGGSVLDLALEGTRGLAVVSVLGHTQGQGWAEGGMRSAAVRQCTPLRGFLLWRPARLPTWLRTQPRGSSSSSSSRSSNVPTRARPGTRPLPLPPQQARCTHTVSLLGGGRGRGWGQGGAAGAGSLQGVGPPRRQAQLDVRSRQAGASGQLSGSRSRRRRDLVSGGFEENCSGSFDFLFSGGFEISTTHVEVRPAGLQLDV